VPRPHRRPRVRLVACAAAGVSLAGLAVIAPPASAAPWSGNYARGTTFSYSGGGCSTSNTGTSAPSASLQANTATSFNFADTSTGTGPTAGDTGAMSAAITGVAQINETAGSFTGLDVTGRMTATATRALGNVSACSAGGNVQAVIAGTFSIASPGLLELDVSNLGSGSTQEQVQLFRVTPGPPSGSQTLTMNEIGRAHRLTTVQAGDYQLSVLMVGAASSTNAPGTPPPSTDVTFELHGVIKPFGVADGAAKGSGAKYLTFPDSLTCASHSVVADFTKKAGKKAKHGQTPVIKKATFFVDDAKARKVSKPHKNTLVTLSGLPDDMVTVRADLKLPGKGVVSVERTYYPCS
jgi:hypothetical protein